MPVCDLALGHLHEPTLISRLGLQPIRNHFQKKSGSCFVLGNQGFNTSHTVCVIVRDQDFLVSWQWPERLCCSHVWKEEVMEVFHLFH